VPGPPAPGANISTTVGPRSFPKCPISSAGRLAAHSATAERASV
jgi:hypothetical protein